MSCDNPSRRCRIVKVPPKHLHGRQSCAYHGHKPSLVLSRAQTVSSAVTGTSCLKRVVERKPGAVTATSRLSTSSSTNHVLSRPQAVSSALPNANRVLSRAPTVSSALMNANLVLCRPKPRESCTMSTTSHIERGIERKSGAISGTNRLEHVVERKSCTVSRLRSRRHEDRRTR